jgi:two-component system KDP operon response regulator KdpE
MGNLRRKLGEDPSQPKYIITEIGVGYRMIDEDRVLP